MIGRTAFLAVRVGAHALVALLLVAGTARAAAPKIQPEWEASPSALPTGAILQPVSVTIRNINEDYDITNPNAVKLITAGDAFTIDFGTCVQAIWAINLTSDSLAGFFTVSPAGAGHAITLTYGGQADVFNLNDYMRVTAHVLTAPGVCGRRALPVWCQR